MNSYLLGRSLGSVSPQALQRTQTTQLLHSIHSAPGIRFDGSDASATSTSYSHDGDEEDVSNDVWAHRSGVNCIAIDKFEGRYMLSGGAEALIKFWDLESAENTSNHFTYRPSAILQKQEPRTHQSKEQSRTSHNFGITHLSFYPFDSQAFLSSSYDHTLKIYATETLSPSASFDLNSTIYSHALSPIADHLLVACATQHPAIRLVDLRSGASAHSLPGHQGAVLSVSWSPRNEHVLASGGSDGTARLWDIRRSAGSLGVLDLEDSVGIGGEDGLGKNARQREHGKAHIGACNGVVWTDSGNHLVTAGHDERVRVWDVSTGANALSHFGPTIKNTHRSSLLPLLPPSHITPPGKQTMLYPNEKDLLLFDLFDGTLLKRLRSPGAAVAQARGAAGQRNVRHRITALAWRAGDVKVYSAHSDGVVRGWVGDDGGVEDEEEKEESGDEGRERKRRALDGVFRELTGRKITFN